MSESDAPLITTVIPTFCRAALLRRAMRSVLEQDYPRLRLAVFDNASDDQTADVVTELARNDPRVSYHRHAHNIGAAANFEFGLRSVDTPFFSILSDDDYLLPGFYRRAIADLTASSEAMFWAGMTLNADELGNIWDARVGRWPREGRYEPPEGLMRVTGGMSPTWTGILFRREVLDRVGFPDQETLGPSDLDFVLKIAAQFPFLLYKTPTAVFTLNASSFSATQPLSSFWPGWKKMFVNMAAIPGLDAADRAELMQRLHADARRMLFRRAANALANGRRDFAVDAAGVLQSEYGQRSRATFLRLLAWLCGRIPGVQDAYSAVFRWMERRIVASRSDLQQAYGGLIRRD